MSGQVDAARRRRRALGAAGATALLAAAAFLGWRRHAPMQPRTQPPASPLTPADEALAAGLAALWGARLPTPDGGELVLAQWQGRALLLNFWATWCPPCVKELPLLDRVAREQSGRLGVLGIAVDRQESVQAFLRRTPVSFPIGVAGFAGSALARDLGNPQGALPYTLLIDRDGRLLARHLGETRTEDVEAWLQALDARRT
ncbi:MAG: TlpA family protein disulfide reductase [Burkholderiaceae bacterium]|nr:TlpA family protein disulfide reductase [Burkholderiaceae bacterium]